MLTKAIAITAEAFKNKFDKGGQPYILHCLYVMNKMDQNDHELMSIAVMHDLIEDTDWTQSKLRDVGFSNRVINGILDLTHKKNEPYDDYIKRVVGNMDSRLVKLEDLGHNSDIRRLKGLSKKDFDRMEKYHRAYSYLKL